MSKLPTQTARTETAKGRVAPPTPAQTDQADSATVSEPLPATEPVLPVEPIVPLPDASDTKGSAADTDQAKKESKKDSPEDKDTSKK